MSAEKTYLTVKEAAKKLGLSAGTVRELARDGKIEALRVGREKPYDVARDGKAPRAKFMIHRSALGGV